MAQRIKTLKRHRHPSDGGAARPSPSARGYGRDWQRASRAKLAADPWCEDCADAGRKTPATQVDHVTALERGGTHDAENLRSLCQSCHSRKTVAVDGGLGRARS